jgi:hypothetical protein
LPKTGEGAPISLDTLTSPPTFCGGTACRGRIVELSPFAGYNDPKKPPSLVLRFDKTVVVHGKVVTVYGQKTPDGPTFVIPACAGSHHDNLVSRSTAANPSPCVKSKSIANDGDLVITVLVLSGDPKIGFK